MHNDARIKLRVIAGALLGLALIGPPATAQGAPAGLGDEYARVAPQLAKNDFGRPIHIESEEAPGHLTGVIYARIDQPFAHLAASLREPGQWCEALLLPFNVKLCTASAANRLSLNVGRKFDQPLPDTHKLVFDYRLIAATPQHLAVELNADAGPVGTRDYRIHFEAMPLEGGRSFLRLRYGYRYGLSGKLAAQAYFATKGRSKIGFTREGDGEAVGGLRGAVERNAMRYFLAIEAYLKSCTLPPEQRFERSAAAWFEATERYPKQLHEMDRAQYLDMKRKEYQRQSELS